MSTRRAFLSAVGSLAAGTAAAQGVCTVFTKARQFATTPEQALARLKEGNARVLAGKTLHCDLLSQIRESAGGQAPFAAILACMDSRASPELIFDQSIGDIFVVRIAGNFIDTDIVGSLEYATKVAGAKLIAVLGHSDCGAVKGAIDGVELGNLTSALANIRPAVLQISDVPGERNSKNRTFVQRVVEQNAKDAAAMLPVRSGVLAALVAGGELRIVSAVHDLSTGAVSWLA